MAAVPPLHESRMRTELKKSRKRAPASLPSAESDLVAEGGNVLASDDAPVSTAEVVNAPGRRLRLNKSGRWVARAIKS